MLTMVVILIEGKLRELPLSNQFQVYQNRDRIKQREGYERNCVREKKRTFRVGKLRQTSRDKARLILMVGKRRLAKGSRSGWKIPKMHKTTPK